MKATLTYHSVDDSRSPVSVSPAAFDAHVAWLASGQVKVLSLDALIRHPDNAGHAVAITFDDGFLNTREPLIRLREHGLPVTVFVVTDQVGRTNAWGGRTDATVPTLPLLSWDDLADLQTLGVEIAAHTRSHAALSTLSTSAIDQELAVCREELATRLGARSGHVAYPYGDVDPRVASRASAHFRYGHTTEFRGMNHRDHPLRLPRLDMYYLRSPHALDRWGMLTGRIAQELVGLRRLLRHGILGGPLTGMPRRWTR
jgi:peptidoglycan/xylan/chitin deacetylase (PgdA/CDA1 family)